MLFLFHLDSYTLLCKTEITLRSLAYYQVFIVDQMNKMKVLFIGKADDQYSSIAATFIKEHFSDAKIVFSKRTEEIPADVKGWEGDLLISYLAQWIIPAQLLKQTKFAAINFHPGPPSYPGIGCTNFAVYNNETEFGITCHHMLEKVDSGLIIAVNRFSVMPIDTVYSITQRCYIEILHVFYMVMDSLLKTGQLPVSHEIWTRKPYTRRQLNELCLLHPEMTSTEMAKRLKATTYGSKIWAKVLDGQEIISYEEALKKGILNESV